MVLEAPEQITPPPETVGAEGVLDKVKTAAILLVDSPQMFEQVAE